MKIFRVSPFTGKGNTLDVPCTPDQYRAWREGKLIQDAMPDVPPELREFLISGITPEEWKETFGKED